MAYPYPHASHNARQQLHESSYSTLSGALEPSLIQSGSVMSNAPELSDGVPISTFLRAQTSQDSQLSAALGPAPFQSQHYSITPQASTSRVIYTPHSYPRSHPLCHEQSTPVRPHYPYPERNVVHPDKHTGCYMPPPSSQTACRTILPSGYHRLSHSTCVDKERAQPSSWSRIGCEHAPIKFNRKGGGKPFRVDELIKTDQTPEVAGNLDLVFKDIGDRYIRVILTWPGYSKFPVERRICTENGTLTREKLLIILAKHIEEYMYYVHRNGLTVEAGYEKYKLVWRPSGQPCIWRDCLITSLTHRSGSTWEVELYVKV